MQAERLSAAPPSVAKSLLASESFAEVTVTPAQVSMERRTGGAQACLHTSPALLAVALLLVAAGATGQEPGPNAQTCALTSFSYHLMDGRPVGFTLTLQSQEGLEVREPGEEAFHSTRGWTCASKSERTSCTLSMAFDHYWYVRGLHKELARVTRTVQVRPVSGAKGCLLSVPIDFPPVPRISATLVPIEGGGFKIVVAGGGKRPLTRASINARDSVAEWSPLRLEPGYWGPHPETDLPDPRTGYVFTVERAGRDYHRYYEGLPGDAHVRLSFRNPVTSTETSLELVPHELFTAAQLSGSRPAPPASPTGAGGVQRAK